MNISISYQKTSQETLYVNISFFVLQLRDSSRILKTSKTDLQTIAEDGGRKQLIADNVFISLSNSQNINILKDKKCCEFCFFFFRSSNMGSIMVKAMCFFKRQNKPNNFVDRHSIFAHLIFQRHTYPRRYFQSKAEITPRFNLFFMEKKKNLFNS